MSEEVEPVWAVVANVVGEHRISHGGQETAVGTPKFHGGAKVYIAGAFWGFGARSVLVVGRYRGKGFVSCTVRTAFLENFRAKLVYDSAVIRRLADPPGNATMLNLDGSDESRLKAEKWVETFTAVSAQWRADRSKNWVEPASDQDEPAGE